MEWVSFHAAFFVLLAMLTTTEYFPISEVMITEQSGKIQEFSVNGSMRALGIGGYNKCVPDDYEQLCDDFPLVKPNKDCLLKQA